VPEPSGPLDGRRRAVTLVFVGIAALSAVAAVSDLSELRLLGRLIDGEPVTDSEIDSSDTRQAAIGGLQGLAFIAGAVVFIVWMHGAYKHLDPAERRYGAGWAIGGWFVPILNLWRPKQIVNDIWRAGGRDASDKEPGWLLLSWWLIFLVANWAANVGVRTLGDDTWEELRTGTIAYLISDSLDVVGAILAIVVVRTATDRLDRRAAETPPPEPEPAAWQAPERPGSVGPPTT
jgi:Domain of unknown function (DUF4328)